MSYSTPTSSTPMQERSQSPLPNNTAHRSLRSLPFLAKLRKSPDENKSKSGHPSTRADPLRADAPIDPNAVVQTSDQAPDQTDNLWLRAEQNLRQDSQKSRILDEYGKIFESKLEVELEPNGSVGRQKQLCQLLVDKVNELRQKKLIIHIGTNDIKVEEKLSRLSRDLLIAKDLIKTAASSSAPAAIACAGVTVILTLFVQAVDQHKNLLQGLDNTSTLLCRLALMEHLYREKAKRTTLSPELSPVGLVEAFESDLTTLYSKVLEFHARAICSLWKNPVTQYFRDAFLRDGWGEFLSDIEKYENTMTRYTAIVHASETENYYKQTLDRLERSNKQQELHHREMETRTAKEEQSKKQKRTNKFLEALYTCHYSDCKDRNDDRVPGTCEWFIQHKLFRHWNSSQKSSLLWVSADPGCGKSVLVKHLVENVLQGSENERTVCYFFFKDDFPDQKSASNALCAILRQIFLAKPHLLRDEFLEKWERDGAKFIQSFQDLWSTLMSVATDDKAGELVCVLDALDECQDSNRSGLIEAIRKFYITDPTKLNLKFLTTSRPFAHIRSGFRELENIMPTIHLSGEAEHEVEKISQEIDLVIGHRVKTMPIRKGLEAEEQSFLYDQLTLVPQRTYLWATLTLDFIEETPGFAKGKVRNAIRKIPQSVNEAYDKILERSTDIEMARIVLGIITAATRPLTLTEMSIMMAIKEPYSSEEEILEDLEPENRFQESLRDICGLFLVVIDTRIYLLHQTAREFLVRDDTITSELPAVRNIQFKWKDSLLLQQSNRILTEKCIWYLMSEFTDIKLKLLLNYAASNWAFHYKFISRNDHQNMKELGTKLCDTASSQYAIWSTAYNYRDHILPRAASPLIIASYLGLTDIVKLLLEAGAQVDANDGRYDETALWEASDQGHEAVDELLVEAVVAVNRGYDETALWQASDQGHEAVVKLLLEAGAQVDAKDRGFERTALWQASDQGHDAVVRLLLEAGAQIDAKDGGFESTALWPASSQGHEAVVKLLLEAGAQVDAKDSNDETALLQASYQGHEAVVRLLLEAGAQAILPG